MSPTLKYRDVDGSYKPILGGTGTGGGGPGTEAPNEVSIQAGQPSDGSELWLRSTDGILLYRNPSNGTYVPVVVTGDDGGPDPVDGNIQAGAGLTGGGLQSSNPTLNVGQGSGITVTADTVAVNKGTLDSWYAPANGQVAVQITDWNLATLNNTAYMAYNASHAPDTGWFYGTVVSYAANFKHQLVWPFANGRWNSGQMWERELEGSVWGDWSRVGIYLHSRDTNDSIVYAQHNGGGSNMGVRRIGWGFNKDSASNSPLNTDNWRVVYYNTAGTYLGVAINAMCGTGLVTFPANKLSVQQLTGEEEIETAQAATVADVVRIVTALMAKAGISVNPAEVLNLVEKDYT